MEAFRDFKGGGGTQRVSWTVEKIRRRVLVKNIRKDWGIGGEGEEPGGKKTHQEGIS